MTLRRHPLTLFIIVLVACGGDVDRASVSDEPRPADIERMRESGELDEWIRAYRSVQDLPEDVPDTTRQRLLELVSYVDSVRSEPTGARVSWRPLHQPSANWEALGRTPLEARFPRVPLALRLELDGYASRIVGAGGGGPLISTVPLRSLDEPNPGAVFVPGGGVDLLAQSIYLRRAPPRNVDDFLIDRYEVTNGEYQAFVDAGGYENPEYWRHPIVQNGEALDWNEAMAELVDRTGIPGPAGWEDGRYPAGAGDHPVTGISWYEAAAYAEFVGRSLPSVYHWHRAAVVAFADGVVPFSNLEGEGLAPVGRFQGVTPTGAYDMAGNAREWLANATADGDARLTLGGSWNDPVHAFSVADPRSPMDRSPANGFRLITDLGDSTALTEASRPVPVNIRDFAGETPASDDEFDRFVALYAYEDRPLDAVVESVDTVSFGIRERITFDAAYGDERMVLYLFLPAERSDAVQPVVYFPGMGAFFETDIERWTFPHSQVDLLVRTGRAVAFPAYKGTLGRQDGYMYRGQDGSTAYRDHVIQWRQDLGRSLDYLETRPEIASDAVGYFGVSWGGKMGSMMVALEPRIRAAVFTIAGLAHSPGRQRAADPFHFAPRVQVPVLMQNGRYDPAFPLEPSARPLFDLLGSEEKRQIVTETGHRILGSELIAEATAWFDRHLGPAG